MKQALTDPTATDPNVMKKGPDCEDQKKDIPQIDPNSDLEGILIDAYAAAYRKNTFGSFRVNNIFATGKSYGIVFGKRMNSELIRERLKQYVITHGQEITDDVEKNVEALVVSKYQS